MSPSTIQDIWHQLRVSAPQPLPLLDYPSYPQRAPARTQGIERSFQGWNKWSMRRYVRGSRPTINAWIGRFEADNLASLEVDTWAVLEDQSSAPQAPVRQVWFPVMREVYHRQKRHPEAGRFRLGRLRGRPAIGERTVGRVMALTKRRSPAMPQVVKKRQKKEPQPHPFKASVAHEDWFIDGRMMAGESDGVRWGSVIVLDGSARPMLAGAGSASEASWIALTGLLTVCQRYGVPPSLLSDKGRADISTGVEAVCTRLGIDHRTMTGKDGERDMHLMATHCNGQRRLYDYPCS